MLLRDKEETFTESVLTKPYEEDDDDEKKNEDFVEHL